jgi:hypothetical protein
MTVSVNGTTGITFNDASTQNTAATGFGFKNRIINGAMMIDQRNAGASVTSTGANFSVDRWQLQGSQTSKYSAQQNAGSVTPPVGFNKYLGVTSLSAYSVTSTDYFGLLQVIEGNNIADLNWGTANASTVTISFWVRSSLTGTFGGSLINGDNTRSYPFSYTISSANTWEQKSVTIAGDTTGTWSTDNSGGIKVWIGLGAGSTFSGTAGSWTGSGFIAQPTGTVSVVGTSGATFYITGVQLEKGSTATSFDYRPYGTEYQLCQRYYQQISASTSSGSYMPYGTGWVIATNYAFVQIPLLTAMRSAPTLTNATVSQFRVSFINCTALALNSPSASTVSLRCDVASGLTIGLGTQLDSNNNQTSYLGFSAEL